MRRIVLVLSAAALMAAMVVASALPAFADPGGIPGHCKPADSGLQTCAGGSGKQGGGGGGLTTDVSPTFPGAFTFTTGGSGEQGGGGGGRNCFNILGTPIACEHGSLP
jgi:hypothetical protein